ncbi:hypothetical protein H3C61_01605 [Candidatus Gracilibacteria bacterium]|nr:hypothetical protein [Candidatus Gracilibacteria bacterium]
MTDKISPEPYQKVAIQNVVQESNGLATAGFVLALINLFISWIPAIGQILWLLAFIFSFIGVFKRPRGLAIAGLIICFINVIIFVVIFGSIVGILSNL